MEVADAFRLISRAIDEGRAAHGYLVVGDIRGNCAELVDLVLHRLFPDETELVDANSHPDVVRLEPQGRSRTIKVERGKDDDGPGMRDGLIEPMETTAFSGGWKVGIVSSVDRLQPAAANAFLKTLEEPPPKTLFFLLTDQPDGILPTIVSRTQRIDLPLPEGLLEDDARERVANAFAARDASELAAILKELVDDSSDEDVPLVRKSFFRTLMSFVRSMMLSDRLPRYRAFQNVQLVETAYRRVETYLPAEAVLSELLDRIAFPEPEASSAFRQNASTGNCA